MLCVLMCSSFRKKRLIGGGTTDQPNTWWLTCVLACRRRGCRLDRLPVGWQSPRWRTHVRPSAQCNTHARPIAEGSTLAWVSLRIQLSRFCRVWKEEGPQRQAHDNILVCGCRVAAAKTRLCGTCMGLTRAAHLLIWSATERNRERYIEVGREIEWPRGALN